MSRTVIIGGPSTGKTTLGREMDPECYSTDEAMGRPWSAQSDALAERMLQGGWTTIEGTAAARGLRKALRADPQAKPCDRVIYLSKSRQPLGTGQRRMASAIRTIFREIEPELRRRGVKVEER
jgi:predicted ATPase